MSVLINHVPFSYVWVEWWHRRQPFHVQNKRAKNKGEGDYILFFKSFINSANQSQQFQNVTRQIKYQFTKPMRKTRSLLSVQNQP